MLLSFTSMDIGKLVQQPQGFKAFIPGKFPPDYTFLNDPELVELLSRADMVLGKLDGISQLLPSMDFFIFMYVRKEAAYSSQIEGTKATMMDSIKADAEITNSLPKDVDDILHYIKAMNFGLKRLMSLPLSLRLIREVHKILLIGARSDYYPTPGEFRTSQNWIGGNSPATARFVPPPVHEMLNALGDLEKFLDNDDKTPILVKAALMHAQFETIHPFLDGNGRAGRMLITFYLCQKKALERPILYLSEYFKRNRDVYFELLHAYHHQGEISRYVKFFLQGIEEVAINAIKTSKSINELREKDMRKVQTFGKATETGLLVLNELYKMPIVDVKRVKKWIGKTRVTANNLVRRFVEINILEQQDETVEYGRTFEYKDYLKIFT